MIEVENLCEEIELEVEEVEEAEEFPNQDLEPVVELFATMVSAVLDDVDHVSIVGSQNRDKIMLKVEFENKENNRLFIGPKFRTVNSILELLRFQQRMPHNRYLEIQLIREDNTKQYITNKRVFGRLPTELERVADFAKSKIYVRGGNAQKSILRTIVEMAKEGIDAIEESQKAHGGEDERSD